MKEEKRKHDIMDEAEWNGMECTGMALSSGT